MDEFEEIWPDDYILYLRSKGWSEQAIGWRVQHLQGQRRRSYRANGERSKKMGSVEAAKYLGIARSTLHSKRIRGIGPVCKKDCNKVIYLKEDLDQWAGENLGVIVPQKENRD